LHEFGYKGWRTFRFSLNVAKLKQDIFALNVTEISQALAKRRDPRPGRIALGCHESDPRDLRWLLRLGGKADCEEHGAKCEREDSLADY
jgi:hypothetical protein